MKNKIQHSNVKKIMSLLFAIFLIITSIQFSSISNAYASNKHTSVMTDLKSDYNFDPLDYPALSLEYMKEINDDIITVDNKPYVEVIQIAESSSGELFLYVYQPTDAELDLTATAVSISRIFSAHGQNMNDVMVYDLELISSVSVFDKYLVKNLEVNQEAYRYYNIIALYRNFNPIIDEAASGSELENYQVGEDVGQQWCVHNVSGEIKYEMATFETMEITVQYTGNIRFQSGIELGNLLGSFKKGDAWFIAFNADDYIIKRIYDADLVYKKRNVDEAWTAGHGTSYSYGDWSDNIKVTLTETDKASYVNEEAIFATKYTWNRISSSQDFISNIENQGLTFTDIAKSQISKSQWVFAFCESEYTSFTSSIDGTSTKSYSDISDVTILRIHFLDNTGTVYNLGVISDRVNPDKEPDAEGPDNKILDILTLIVALILFVLLIIVCQILGIFSILKTILWFIIKWALKIAFYILASPYYLIKWIVGK